MKKTNDAKHRRIAKWQKELVAHTNRIDEKQDGIAHLIQRLPEMDSMAQDVAVLMDQHDALNEAMGKLGAFICTVQSGQRSSVNVNSHNSDSSGQGFGMSADVGRPILTDDGSSGGDTSQTHRYSAPGAMNVETLSSDCRATIGNGLSPGDVRC